MLKIDSLGAIYCLSCGDDKEGVLLSLEDRAELIGQECGECKEIIA
jgi:hypothetical protein